jgi:tetratricopeptide (TPR) repeat protein
MDIQDTFIQRVKFISSHMFFAFWIGYGLIFLLAHVDGWFSKSPMLKQLAAVVAVCLPLTPILVNWYNSELLYVYGGAEQNGHDFGWQFGNYELRGAAAISEELSPDEEPLPNPSYPPEMGQHAIFFGGTDPGRFVPTYMIYSADVRSDVYLITQNALADNTYLNVMRDLYGNDIWIPSVNDSAKAFSTYIHDIETGKRPMTAGITKQNGRVQISGVLGVMEINGILAKNIFDHNNYKHEFYVEESYVIRWMYPYLEPHGLIMKINHDRLPRLTQTMINNDMDFWDWYTRRLTTNEKFQRDVVARKSFSKLRSALAGLYASRGLRAQAEIAFLEACKLYPLSPEANFRLAEVYMRSMQFQKAKDLIIKFGDMDPANNKVEDFIGRINKVADTYNEISKIEKENSGGKFTTASALKLAKLYRQVGQNGRFNSLLQSILHTKNLPPQIQFQVAVAYDQAKMYPQMNQALNMCLASLPPNTAPKAFLNIARMFAKAGNGPGTRKALKLYLKKVPNDWKAWMDLATIELQLKNTAGATEALGQALHYGGPEARQTIQSNPALNNLLRSRASRAKKMINFGL